MHRKVNTYNFVYMNEILINSCLNESVLIKSTYLNVLLYYMNSSNINAYC